MPHACSNVTHKNMSIGNLMHASRYNFLNDLYKKQIFCEQAKEVSSIPTDGSDHRLHNCSSARVIAVCRNHKELAPNEHRVKVMF